MKLILAAIVIIFAVSATAIDPKESDNLFREYLDKFKIRLQRSGKGYEDKTQNFLNTLKLIENNKELRINSFAHLSYDEFVQTRTGYIPLPDNENFPLKTYNFTRRGARASLPASWDWRKRYAVVRQVQDQSNCGSCWVFAGIGAIEGQMSLKYLNHEKLSEQEALECIVKYKGWGCGGGNSIAVFEWAASVGGVTNADKRPYRNVDNTQCETFLNSRSYGSKTIATYVQVPVNNEEAMKDALVNVGPIHVSLHASKEFVNVGSAIFTDPNNLCLNQGNNHAVLLVGYGTEYGQDYWLIKNSWGTGWGAGGYGKIARGRNLCGIAKDPFYPVLA